MAHVLSFERPVVDLLGRIRELQTLATKTPELAVELGRLQERTAQLVRRVYSALTPMEKVRLSRHPNRPYSLDYIDRFLTDFVELHGDRRFAEDCAIIGGLAKLRGRSLVLLAHQKGRNTKQNLHRNFGMANPEGYRKALRLYALAERFRLPVLTLVDTPGAYPGIGAEERGQAEAIAACIEAMASATVPIVTAVIGEGGSGGALALGVANRVLVLEFAFYSVISPEGCAAILWKDGQKAAEAAARLRVTAPDLLAFGVVDRIVQEPAGGAHQDVDAAAAQLETALVEAFAELDGLTGPELREHRYQRFRRLGAHRIAT